ncbi:centromere-associated protein E isoform X5 [Corythoichthys intestinalis]|uniref:centromere-associated protein E isoform X5 n=1 Tax=Corythoichthys intestinalis TaxID=161448 RepID=UPI0025A501C9|nr:centromere-associated protein E isoform X5 [Corythoichthys intestinalis]
MAEESAVKVCVRVRPFLEREKSDSSEKTKSVEVFWEANENSLRQLDDGTTTKSFAFDRVFTAEETTNQLYQDIAKPLVVSTVEGYNGTIFAYGQTASGKTFTMMGSDNNPGIIPLAVDDVFQTIKKCPKKEFLLRVSYMEIYNETVTDLLVDSYKRKPLEVREDVNKNISVADLTEELVTTPAQALKWIRLGEKNRHYGSTKMNHRSSRSHTIFRMILESRERSDLASGENADGGIIVSHLNLVDLAGSERASQTGAEGARFKEGCMINRSLFTLGQVIKKLSEESQRSFISYRDSKLTRILQNSLGGNAKTVIMCTITTASLDETLSTLQFASAAKKMKNDPHVTEVCDDGALLKRYRNEIVDLKKRLQEVSSVTATEKEVLVQVLQEKEQLQLEQEDRIKNLTKLLVTSNNITNVLPVPKRRVTWGGKMLRHSHSSTPDSDASNCSFSVSVCQKTKTLQSCVGKISEEGEEFYSDWTFPDEPFDDTNSCEDFVTLPSCGNRSADRVTELELQLQTVDQQKQQAVDQILAMEQKAAEIDLKLKMETDEKELLASERDYLKQQLAIIKSHAMREKEEAAALSQKLKEKMEQDEFVSLEEKFAKEHEIELQNEISSLKNALESHELQLLELKKKLDMVSEELKEKTKIADDLQNMCGKDLAQEVANLRRSLDDAQALGRETKKEWALLRSENTALEELKMTLTVTNEKMEAEVTSLRSQLSSEKSNFKKMQMDLQKELNVVFNENTKLAALCDGKVPRNIMDSVELESAVTKLKKELEASQQAERLLRTQLEELELIQAHQNEGHNPEKQISAEDLEKLELAVRNVTAERDQFQMDLQENIDMMIENQEELRNSLGEIVALKQRIKELEDMTLGLEEIKTHAAENESLLQSLQSQLQQQVQRNKDIESTGQENQVQLQNQIKILAMELEIANAERDALCNKESEHQTSLEETQKLISRITSLSEEKDELLETLEGLNQEKSHLNAQLEDSIETTNTLAMELETVKAERDGLCNKEEPHQTSLEETQKLMSRIISLSKEKDGLLETLEGISQEKSQLNAQLEDKIETTKTLAMELETVKAERDGLCNKKAEHQTSLEETQKLMSKITSLSEEKDELLETVEGLNKEKSQLNAQLEDHIETITILSMELETLKAESDGLCHKEAEQQTSLEETQKLMSKITSLSEEKDELLETVESLNQEKTQLNAQLEDKIETITILSMELESLKAARDGLCNKVAEQQTSLEETQKLMSRIISLSEEKDGLLETLEGLNQEKSQLKAQLEDNIETRKTLAMELENVKAERDCLCDKEAEHQTSLEETQKLMSRIQSLSGEKDELLETVEGLSQEKSQLNVQLEDKIETISILIMELETLKAERDGLCNKEAEHQTSLEETQKLMSRIQSLSGEKDELLETVEGLSQEKSQLNVQLEDKIETIKILAMELETVKEERDDLCNKEAKHQTSLEEAQNLMSRITSLSQQKDELLEKVDGVSQEKSQLKAQLEDNIEKTKILTMELETVKAERDGLFNKAAEHQTFLEETQKLMSQITSLSEEKDGLLETAEGLSQEKFLLNAQLEETMEMVKTLTGKLEHVENEQNVQLSEKSSTLEKLTCKVSSLSEERIQLQNKMEELISEKEQLKSELQSMLLMEAKETISVIHEKHRNCDQKMPDSKVAASSRLQDSSLELEELFERFQQFIDACTTPDPIIRDKILTMECFLNESETFPHAILKAHSIVIGFGPKNLRPLSNIIDVLLASGKTCKRAFQQLVENDVTMFEEGRLQDIFRGRSPATSCSFQDRECCSGEGHRLSELVKKRQLYVQKMSNVLKNLWAGLDSYHNELSAEVRERARFSKLVQEELNRLPLVMSRLESLFWAESDCRSKVTQRRKDIFQGILDERIAQCQELQHLKAQAECRLQEEKSMHCTLQQTLEETPTRSPQALFGNQQLIRLRQSEEEVKVLCLKNKQLEEAHHKANSCVSEYKMATQQLQIELLASQAQVVELKNATKTLKSQLQDLEKPEAAELQKVQAQLFKMELELRAASDEHRQEMERKDMALHLKEESIRKLKETLRTLQQQGEESFLQGEELADRLLNPRSLGNKSSVVQNEYVKQLQVKIAHLENVISTQQADLNKWKNRAVKMKYKSKADVKPSPPSTPTKRGLPASISVLLQSPQKPQNILGSPKMRFNTPQVPLNSPKSKFFDDDGYGESLARTRPAHFFDNSTLGLTADAKSDENSQKPNDCITQ